MAEPIFALEHISFTYPGGRQVFRDMDFALYPDRKIGLYGPNGSGKTTFFRLIMGLAAPQEGRILFHGRPLETEKDFRELRCKVGLVLQHAEDQLFCPTVLEDVAFGPLNLGCTQDEARDRAASTLERLGLAGFENRLTHRLSGGEKKLVSLATVLVMEPGSPVARRAHQRAGSGSPAADHRRLENPSHGPYHHFPRLGLPGGDLFRIPDG